MSRTIIPKMDYNVKDMDEVVDSFMANAASDYVVNVEFASSKNNVSLRLDIVKTIGDSGRYYSNTYILSGANCANGIFELLDDYYAKRFKFFNSNKSTQSLLMALVHIEKDIIKDTGMTFMDFCETMNDKALEEISSDERFSNVLGCTVANGYNIGGEAMEMSHIRHSFIESQLDVSKYGLKLKKEFDRISNTMENSKFCCVCINASDKIPTSFLVEPLIGMPLVVYDKEFSEIFISSNMCPLLDSELFKAAGIDKIKVDLVAVHPKTTIKDIMGIFGNEGEVTTKYNDKLVSDSELFLGKFSTLTFEKGIKRGKTQQTIIR